MFSWVHTAAQAPNSSNVFDVVNQIRVNWFNGTFGCIDMTFIKYSQKWVKTPPSVSGSLWGIRQWGVSIIIDVKCTRTSEPKSIKFDWQSLYTLLGCWGKLMGTDPIFVFRNYCASTRFHSLLCMNPQRKLIKVYLKCFKHLW